MTILFYYKSRFIYGAKDDSLDDAGKIKKKRGRKKKVQQKDPNKERQRKEDEILLLILSELDQ